MLCVRNIGYKGKEFFDAFHIKILATKTQKHKDLILNIAPLRDNLKQDGILYKRVTQRC